ncbi:MAG: phosphohistidine phosphatase SixA [Gammaproteobacteria bacterium]|nr:phosphohistidine phosphatase SixA [Gammaproteobacteria bacterium]
MPLYVVQHGDAVPKDVDPDRPLSEQGRTDVARIAAFLATAGVSLQRVVHSGKARARQTAERLAQTLAPAGGVEAREGLGPTEPVEPLAEALRDAGEDLAVVGHMPFVGRLVARFVSGQTEHPVVAFQPGSVVCLEQDEAGRWVIAWMVRPALLAG